MLKLVGDTGYIHSELTKRGFDWKGDRSSFLSVFLGEGMHIVLSEKFAKAAESKSEPMDGLPFVLKAVGLLHCQHSLSN